MLYSDFLFAFVFAVLFPVVGMLGFRRLLARLRDGVPPHRPSLYRNTLLGHWALLGILVYLWLASGRSAQALGLGLSVDAAFGLGLVLTLVCIGMLAAQMISVLRADQETVDRLASGFGRLALIVPHNARELTQFYLVSVTAGVVEELLWRGYLMWFLTHYLSLAAAALVCAVAFGFAHGYQGWRHVPKVMLVGAALTGLYVVTGSIWMSMLLHIAIDAMQGRLAYEVSRRASGGLPEIA